ncbi:MAG: exopolysaccharide biosynthesis protein [Xenococcaceae cyanobacterium MO_188.B32]|nr:exopolysaccharide biosynthesis protein [Xenococcaceae cyanobacterium MO_188.B32]
MTEQTPGSNLDPVGFLALPIAFGVRNAGIERLARTRLEVVSRYWLLRRFHGICLVWNAILMALPLPIPFTNLLPAYTILVLAIGLLESDGLMLLIGYGLTGATTTFFISVIGGVVMLLMYLG